MQNKVIPLIALETEMGATIPSPRWPATNFLLPTRSIEWCVRTDLRIGRRHTATSELHEISADETTSRSSGRLFVNGRHPAVLSVLVVILVGRAITPLRGYTRLASSRTKTVGPRVTSRAVDVPGMKLTTLRRTRVLCARDERTRPRRRGTTWRNPLGGYRVAGARNYHHIHRQGKMPRLRLRHKVMSWWCTRYPPDGYRPRCLIHNCPFGD